MVIQSSGTGFQPVKNAGKIAVLPKRRQKTGIVILYILMIAIAFISLGPFIFSILGSFKTTKDVLSWPPRVFSPPFILDNYRTVLVTTPLFSRWLLNSALLAAIAVITKVFLCSLAGYAFARIEFPGRNILFVVTLGTMMIPGQVTMIPNYIILNKFKWINTYYAIIVPGLVDAFGIFLMTQFFKSIPKSIEEAAKIDGCSRFGIYWKIALPLAKPALAALAIFKFQGSWNDFMWPLIVLQTPKLFTLPLGLNYFKSTYYTFWNLILAGSMFNSVPIIIIFVIFQRYFIRGISLSGLKG